MGKSKLKTCCFTGHRPKKLPWGSDEGDIRCVALKSKIKSVAEDLIVAQGYDRFISGMAQGADTICAEVALSLKILYPHVQLECAVPNCAFGKNWRKEKARRFEEILKRADLVTYVTDRKAYSIGDLMKRNAYMVDASDLVLALYIEGQGGGTKNTLDYARRKNKEIIIIEP